MKELNECVYVCVCSYFFFLMTQDHSIIIYVMLIWFIFLIDFKYFKCVMSKNFKYIKNVRIMNKIFKALISSNSVDSHLGEDGLIYFTFRTGVNEAIGFLYLSG